MHSSSLILFAVVLIIALQSLPISGKAVKSTATTTTTTLAPATTKLVAVVKVPEKAIVKPAGKVSKKKPKKPKKKSKKPKQSPWKVPDADQKKLFNDYKTILRAKLNARHQNISATYQLEPVKYGSQTVEKSILHHFLIKLPDSKYAHAIIGTEKDAKKPAVASEHSASIRRTIYDNLQAAEA
ncbi:hypothetical protein I4U23_029964 [Adineta vaga]|nr:hypothetical protein I4U23_029964 [Adineta vaga]